MHRTREDGAVVVEFAFVFIVFSLLLWGLISYGVIFAVQQSVTHAAAEAARSASAGNLSQTDAEQAARDTVADQLSWLPSAGYEPIDVTFANCGYASSPSADCVTVEVTFDWENHGIVPTLFDVATPSELTSRAVLQRN